MAIKQFVMEAFFPILSLLIIGCVVWVVIDFFSVGCGLVRVLRGWLRGTRRREDGDGGGIDLP
jgi:hypothetical protein